mgnify:CR=1 FL=1
MRPDPFNPHPLDLIFEGIATLPGFAEYVEAVRETNDLIYEGIATDHNIVPSPILHYLKQTT